MGITKGEVAQLRTSRVGILLLASLVLLSSSCARHLPSAPVPGEDQGAGVLSGSGDGVDGVLVTLAGGVDPVEFGNDYDAVLVETGAWGGHRYRARGDEAALVLATRMKLDLRVVTSETNTSLETAETRQQSSAFDDGYGTAQTYHDQPATDSIDLDGAHRVSTGSGVVVAVLDTGVDPSHPELAGHLRGGWDFVDSDADPTDDGDGLDNDGDGRIDEGRGHGSHVAGIVARTAPDAALLVVRVLDAEGRGDVMSVASGIRWALDHGAQVINLSLGMLQESPTIEALVSLAESRGVVCVASAGNWGAEEPEEFPAASHHVISVAAVDAERHPAIFTSFGDHVAMCAPGVAVRSTYLDGGYALWSGTSMAAPFVSGAAALLLSLHPTWGRGEVVARLASTASPLDFSLGTALREELGAGALQAGAALAPDANGP